MNKLKKLDKWDLFFLICAISFIMFCIWGLFYLEKKVPVEITDKFWISSVHTQNYSEIIEENWELPENATLISVDEKLYEQSLNGWRRTYKPYYKYSIYKWVEGKTYSIQDSYEQPIRFEEIEESENLRISEKNIEYFFRVSSPDKKYYTEVSEDSFKSFEIGNIIQVKRISLFKD